MILLYLTIVIVANMVTATFAPFNFGVFIIPMGTFFIGLTFLLRDFIQVRYGRQQAIKTIVIATALSLILSVVMKDLLIITIASAASFLVAELLDTEIFSRLSKSFKKRVLISGLFGGLADSIIFVVIGLSPLFSNILPWSAVLFGILGQFVFKFLTQLIVISLVNGKGIAAHENSNR